MLFGDVRRERFQEFLLVGKNERPFLRRGRILRRHDRRITGDERGPKHDQRGRHQGVPHCHAAKGLRGKQEHAGRFGFVAIVIGPNRQRLPCYPQHQPQRKPGTHSRPIPNALRAGWLQARSSNMPSSAANSQAMERSS